MKFKITEKPRYWWPVVVRVPDPDNPGKIIEQKLKVLFEPQGRAEAIAALEKGESMTSQAARADHEHAQLSQVVKDWSDVEDPDSKQAVAFSPEMFAMALQQSWFRNGVYNAYADSLNGVEAKLGN